jgi:hypothetical protein
MAFARSTGTLLKGVADVYQLESSPFYELTREFYRD